jgi:protein Tex
MNERHVRMISSELNLTTGQVEATISLLEDGGTIPFVARYRKEATGSLDEVLIAAIRDRLAQLQVLDKRRESILKSLEDQGILSDELKEKVLLAETLSALEDLYLPYRPKRRTRAAIAREKGLEPLARLIFDQPQDMDPLRAASDFVQPENGVHSVEDALSGARDIIAEWVNEDGESRARLRNLFAKQGTVRSKVVAGKESEGILYRDYYDWEEPVAGAPSHRVLAARRGEKEGFLTFHVAPSDDDALSILQNLFLKGESAASQQVDLALQDGYKRLLAPSLETETKQWAKERADVEAIRVFADNIRHLLMAPPLGAKRILALDPGFRTGCKLVCLDPQGKLAHNETIYPHSGTQSAAKAAERITRIVRELKIEAIAIGNGTAGRETESFVRSLRLPEGLHIMMVDESGASVYSASQAARDEFPDQDVTVRGSVSIGRRLMDPLAELVKIDPKAIGVGQYQHDVDQSALKRCLDDVVMSCVNGVGVDVNTSSAQLLAYVSGLGVQLARNIVAYRDENGAFRSRKELKKVPRLGPKAFEQAGGFLRIRSGKDPLDASAVHPEAYHIVETMVRDLGCTVSDLMLDESLRKRIDPRRYVTDSIGLPTLTDILAELAKPGRDPRETFEAFSFAPGIETIEDVKPGMKLPGIVTNVTAFGAFVDIGVHRGGLVHVSELSDRFVKDPHDVVRVQQKVLVTVLEVDIERNRISLSLKTSPGAARPGPEERPAPQPGKARDVKASSGKKSGFNNPFAAAGLDSVLKKK